MDQLPNLRLGRYAVKMRGGETVRAFMFNIRLDARLMRHLLGTWRQITKAQNSEKVRQSNVLEWNLTRLDSNIRIAHLIK
jgi:hypothetical protein